MRRLLLIAVAVSAVVAALSAQVSLSTNQPFTLTWTHDGVDTSEYRVYTGSSLTATVPVSALVNGAASYRFQNGLSNGTYTLAVSAYGPGGESAKSPIGVTVSTNTSTPAPPGSVTIVPDPQVWYVQVEDFDSGAEGTAYHDTTAGNSGGAYRTTGVDIQACQDVNGGYNVGWAVAGEWLRYSVNVATTGTYTLSFRVASPGQGGTFHLEVNGVNVTGPVTVPNTGGWQTWTTVSKTVSLQQGIQTWRLVLDANGPTMSVGNFNWMGAVYKGP